MARQRRRKRRPPRMLIVPFTDSIRYALIEDGREKIYRCPQADNGRLIIAVAGVFFGRARIEEPKPRRRVAWTIEKMSQRNQDTLVREVPNAIIRLRLPDNWEDQIHEEMNFVPTDENGIPI